MDINSNKDKQKRYMTQNMWVCRLEQDIKRLRLAKKSTLYLKYKGFALGKLSALRVMYRLGIAPSERASRTINDYIEVTTGNPLETGDIGLSTENKL